MGARSFARTSGVPPFAFAAASASARPVRPPAAMTPRTPAGAPLTRSRAAGAVEQSLCEEEKPSRERDVLLGAAETEGPGECLDQLERIVPALRALDPPFRKRLVDRTAVIDGGADALAVRVRELRRPVAASAPADDRDARAVDVAACEGPVEDGVPQAFRVERSSERRLARAGHVEREDGEATLEIRLHAAVLLVRVDAAPVHDQGWARASARDAQGGDDLGAFARPAAERDAHDLQQRTGEPRPVRVMRALPGGPRRPRRRARRGGGRDPRPVRGRPPRRPPRPPGAPPL